MYVDLFFHLPQFSVFILFVCSNAFHRNDVSLMGLFADGVNTYTHRTKMRKKIRLLSLIKI